MRLAIDATNIRAGGGVTHLVELLRAGDPQAHGFERIYVWAPASTLDALEHRPWLVKKAIGWSPGNYFARALWNAVRLRRLLAAESVDLLFVPGGSFATRFRPVVTMSRNLLPFQWRELLRSGLAVQTLKMILLRAVMKRCYRNADGVIFLTNFARDVVLKVTGPLTCRTAVIPHGVAERFFTAETKVGQQVVPIERPVRVLYVSAVEAYKHPWTIVEAIGRLRLEGWSITLDLVGPANKREIPRLQRTMRRVDPAGEFTRYRGDVPYAELHEVYSNADLFVFASTCETFSNTLLEAMAAGLPIACSDQGALRELLGCGGVYFDPEDPVSVATGIRLLLSDPEIRRRTASASSKRAAQHSWARCSRETFSFLAKVCTDSGDKRGWPADPASSDQF